MRGKIFVILIWWRSTIKICLAYDKNRLSCMCMFKKLCVNIATLFGMGNSPILPGTLGAFFGTLFYASIADRFSYLEMLCITLFMLLLAIIVCDIAESEIGEKDPSKVILDEFVVMPIVFSGTNMFFAEKVCYCWVLLAGFLIFRLFDIIKPFGISATQSLSGGVGIVVDDVVAAVYSNIVMTLIGIFLTVL